MKLPCLSHNFISINLTFDVGDQVREIISPAKFGLDPMSGQDATWGQHIRVLRLFYCFCLFLFFNIVTAHTCEPIFAHNSSTNTVSFKEDPFGIRNV